MNVVAVYDWGKDVGGLSIALATALGRTVYEVRSRLLVPRGGPSVVGVFREWKKAEESAAKLRKSGFKTIVLREEEVESDDARFLVRNFEFTMQSLRAGGSRGQTMALPYTEIKWILYGSAVTLHTEKELVKERKFSAGRAIMTQGLMLTKKTKREVRIEERNRERFLYLYAPNRQTVVLREHGLRYDSLGKARHASGAANFNHVISELKRQRPGVPFDDRLLTRGGQGQILGPLLTPEDHLEIAVALLGKVSRSA